MLTTESVVIATPDLVACDLGNESVILDVRKGRYYGLNDVGARILHFAAAPISVAGLRDTIVAEFDVNHAQCERDLIALLKELADAGLVEVRSAGPG